MIYRRFKLFSFLSEIYKLKYIFRISETMVEFGKSKEGKWIGYYRKAQTEEEKKANKLARLRPPCKVCGIKEAARGSDICSSCAAKGHYLPPRPTPLPPPPEDEETAKGQPMPRQPIPQPPCSRCGIYPALPGKTICKNCDAQVEKKGFFGHFGHNFKKRVYEIIILTAVGAALIIFGLQYAGIGIILFAFRIAFPSERQILENVAQGGELYPINHWGALYFRAMLKVTGAVLITIQVLTFHLLLSLAFLFAFYFTLPTSYSTDRPYKSIEAWVRPVIGFLVSFLLYAVMSVKDIGYAVMFLMTTVLFPPSLLIWFMTGFTEAIPAFSLFLLSFAFFFTFPKVEEAEKGYKGGITNKVIVDIRTAAVGKQGERVGSIVFIFLMILALTSSLFWLSEGLKFVFIVIWVMSLAGGLLTGREGRPFVGLLMIGIALFAFTTTFTGVVGTAIFGQWWPQIQTFTEATFAPISDVSTQVSLGIGDAWLLVTNPTEYYRIIKEREEAATSRVTTGGVIQSIEITEFTLFSSILEPSEPLQGSIELENKGEFDAGEIILDLKAIWSDPLGVAPNEEVGSLKTLVCTGDSTEEKGIGKCTWPAPIYQREIRAATFTYNKGSSWGDLANKENLVYTHAGESVDFVANLTFDYSVNVSIPLEVINQSIYEAKLLNGEIILEPAESQYSGGPVKATINTQKQPIKNEEASLIKASVFNEGSGSLLEIKSFTIFVHRNLTPGKVESSQFNEGCSEDSSFHDGSDKGDKWKDYFYIECKHNKEIKQFDFKRVTFYIEPDIGNQADLKTYQIIGLVEYTYRNSQKQTLQIS